MPVMISTAINMAAVSNVCLFVYAGMFKGAGKFPTDRINFHFKMRVDTYKFPQSSFSFLPQLEHPVSYPHV